MYGNLTNLLHSPIYFASVRRVTFFSKRKLSRREPKHQWLTGLVIGNCNPPSSRPKWPIFPPGWGEAKSVPNLVAFWDPRKKPRHLLSLRNPPPMRNHRGGGGGAEGRHRSREGFEPHRRSRSSGLERCPHGGDDSGLPSMSLIGTPLPSLGGEGAPFSRPSSRAPPPFAHSHPAGSFQLY